MGFETLADIGQGASGIGSLVSGIGSLFKKVPGIPTPEIKSASQMATEKREYVDKMFPEANIQEKMALAGGNLTGTTQDPSVVGAKQQANMQSRQLKQEKNMKLMDYMQQMNIVKEQQKSSVLSAAVPYGIEALESVQSILDGKPGGSYLTQVQNQRKELEAMIPNINAKTKTELYELLYKKAMYKNIGLDNAMKKIEVQIHDRLMRARVTSEKYKTIQGTMESIVNGLIDNMEDQQKVLSSPHGSNYKRKVGKKLYSKPEADMIRIQEMRNRHPFISSWIEGYAWKNKRKKNNVISR